MSSLNQEPVILKNKNGQAVTLVCQKNGVRIATPQLNIVLLCEDPSATLKRLVDRLVLEKLVSQ